MINNLIKGLLGVNYGREAALTLHALMPHIAKVQLNQFSQSLIVSSCLKFFRQESDPFLRKLSLSFLSLVYNTPNLPVDSETDIFASLTAVITEQQLPSELMTQAITLAKKVLLNDSRVLQQGSVVKLLVGRLMILAGGVEVYGAVVASVLELLRSVLAAGRMEVLAGADLADMVLPFLNLAEKHPNLTDEHTLLLSASLDILYLSC